MTPGTEWRAEFEKDGPRRFPPPGPSKRPSRAAVFNVVWHGSFEEPKRQFAIRWLREMEKETERLAVDVHWYTKWTFVAAVVAVIVSLIGMAVTHWSTLPPLK